MIRSSQQANSRQPVLTPERVQLRYSTLLEAFQTADRRGRGYLPYDRVLEIYGLYFNSSVAMLTEPELANCAEKFIFHTPNDGSLVVEYAKLAEELRKRDFELLSKPASIPFREGALPTYAGVGPPAAGAVPVAFTSAPAHSVMSPENFEHLSLKSPLMQPAPRGQDALPSVHYGGGCSDTASMAAPNCAAGAVLPSCAFMPSAHSQAFSGQPHVGRGEQYGREPDHSSVTAQTDSDNESLSTLLHRLKQADINNNGHLHTAQLLMCCRMHGVEEPSSLLHAMVRDASKEQVGSVNYVAFVQQLASYRAGARARANILATNS